MNLPRIVDIDHDRSRTVRAALDCFAPLAITIRARPSALGFQAIPGNPDITARAR